MDEAGNVLHNDKSGIRVSWYGIDSDSGVKKYSVAIGTKNEPEMVLPFTDFGEDTSGYIRNIDFKTTSDTGVYYIVSVIATNGAGLESDVGISKNIFVQKANVPGIVFDGRRLFKDAKYSRDKASVSGSFYGFESEACGILKYEWAIGTSAYSSNVLTYTTFGLVLLNTTHGQCQINMEVNEGAIYFITVRAVTSCEGEYILSASDGIIVDRTAPSIYWAINDTHVVQYNNVLYQKSPSLFSVQPSIFDINGVETAMFGLGSGPGLTDLQSFTLNFESLVTDFRMVPGQTVFIICHAVDGAGNDIIWTSAPIVYDLTPPVIKDLQCTPFVSVRQSTVLCSWMFLVETESVISSFSFKLKFGEIEMIKDIPVTDFHITRNIAFDLYDELIKTPDIDNILIEINISNINSLEYLYGRNVVMDKTGPVGTLEIVTRTSDDEMIKRQWCQIPKSYIEANVLEATDIESGINRNRYVIPYLWHILIVKRFNRLLMDINFK